MSLAVKLMTIDYRSTQNNRQTNCAQDYDEYPRDKRRSWLRRTVAAQQQKGRSSYMQPTQTTRPHTQKAIIVIQGPSIKYVTLFLAKFDPPPPVTLCHTSQDPPKVRHTSRTLPRFLVGLVQKSRTKVPSTNSISIVRGSFLSGEFCPG